jgi:quinol monooxygenase YgiN
MTYYFGIPIDYSSDFSKTTSMFAFEVYGRREDLYETHLSSPAMQKFLATIPEHTTTDLDLNHYSSLGGGFLDRDGDKKECAIMCDQRIGCKDSTARDRVGQGLKALCEKVKESVKGSSDGVFTFMGFSCLDNDTSLRIYSRFESRDAMENFLRRSDVLKFWADSKSDVASMEARGYLPNGKGWLHRSGDGVESGKAI